MLGRLPAGAGGTPPYSPKTAELKPIVLRAALAVALIILALDPSAGASSVHTAHTVHAPFHVEGPARSAAETVSSGFQVNYNLSLVTIPNLNPLTAYVDNYRTQYPTVAFAGTCAGGILYIDNFSNLKCFDPYGGDVHQVAGPLTLLYQKTLGLQAQIDNEFQLDTSYGVALLYGNLTTSPGFLTVETADLTNGTIHQVTTPVQMENNVQCDYIGGGDVVIFNATGIGGEPAYFANIYNGSSWPAGPSIGIAADNIYWVWQLGAFLDVQGVHLTEFKVEGNSLVQTSGLYFNNSGVSSVTAVDGTVYKNGAVALDLATNLGNYIEVAALGGTGQLVARGSYAYLTQYALAIQRYSYTTSFVWANGAQGAGATVLFDPFTNGTQTVPGFAGRQEGSGANGNFEFENPYTNSVYLSLNASLVGRSSLAPNQFVWGTQLVVPGVSGGGAAASGSATFLGLPLYVWVFGVIGLGAFVVFLSARELRA